METSTLQCKCQLHMVCRPLRPPQRADWSRSLQDTPGTAPLSWRCTDLLCIPCSPQHLWRSECLLPSLGRTRSTMCARCCPGTALQRRPSNSPSNQWRCHTDQLRMYDRSRHLSWTQLHTQHMLWWIRRCTALLCTRHTASRTRQPAHPSSSLMGIPHTPQLRWHCTCRPRMLYSERRQSDSMCPWQSRPDTPNS